MLTETIWVVFSKLCKLSHKLDPNSNVKDSTSYTPTGKKFDWLYLFWSKYGQSIFPWLWKFLQVLFRFWNYYYYYYYLIFYFLAENVTSLCHHCNKLTVMEEKPVSQCSHIIDSEIITYMFKYTHSDMDILWCSTNFDLFIYVTVFSCFKNKT